MDAEDCQLVQKAERSLIKANGTKAAVHAALIVAAVHAALIVGAVHAALIVGAAREPPVQLASDLNGIVIDYDFSKSCRKFSN